jgi:hypothetical protein
MLSLQPDYTAAVMLNKPVIFYTIGPLGQSQNARALGQVLVYCVNIILGFKIC